jgi:hypothetical protein
VREHQHAGLTVTDEREAAENDRAREVRVATLAHEIAETINAGQVEGRELLREIAVSLLRDEVQTTEPSPPAPGSVPVGSFNAFGIGIPLILMGGVMVFLFPPVGLLMFAAAAVMIAWGVGTTLLARN